MKRTLTVALTLFFISNVAFAQQPEMSIADSLRTEGDIPEAIIEYLRIFEVDPQNENNTYNLACSYAMTWKQDSAFHYLEIALEKDTTVWALNDPDLFPLTKHEKWAAIENKQIEKVEAKHGAYGNKELSKELWRMKMKDQAYYYHLRIAEKKMDRSSPVIKALWDLKHILNEENLTRIKEIIDEHGWPKQSVVGGNAASTTFLIIQHSDLATQKQYIGILKDACEAEEARWANYALMYDRIETGEDRPQKYGSQVRRDSETGEYAPFPILEPEYVNKRRKEVGLGPIEDYLGRWNIVWDVEQKN